MLITGQWHILDKEINISDFAFLKIEKPNSGRISFSNWRLLYLHYYDYKFVFKNSFEEAIIGNGGKLIKNWYFTGYRYFSNGLIVVRKFNLFGLFFKNENIIEKRGHWVKAENFCNQYIKVWLGKDRYVLVDEKGNEKNDFLCQEIKKIGDNRILFKKDNKYGIANQNLEILVNPNWYNLNYLSDNEIIVKKDKKMCGMINIDNKIIFDIEYQFIKKENDDYIGWKGSEKLVLSYPNQ